MLAYTPSFFDVPIFLGHTLYSCLEKRIRICFLFTYSKTICRLNNLQTFWCNPYLCSRYPSMRLHFRERMCLVTACMYAHLQSRRNWNFDLIGFKSILVFSPESTRSVRQWGKLILTHCWFWRFSEDLTFLNGFDLIMPRCDTLLVILLGAGLSHEGRICVFSQDFILPLLERRRRSSTIHHP